MNLGFVVSLAIVGVWGFGRWGYTPCANRPPSNCRGYIQYPTDNSTFIKYASHFITSDHHIK